jgi:hypothetical protein
LKKPDGRETGQANENLWGSWELSTYENHIPGKKIILGKCFSFILMISVPYKKIINICVSHLPFQVNNDIPYLSAQIGVWYHSSLLNLENSL